MPSKPGPVIIVRPPGRPPYAVPLERLTELVRAARMITKADLKAKRLQAMAVAGTQMQATSDMFDRVIALGERVSTARTAAETAQTDALQAQIADLAEMADDLDSMGNGAGVPLSSVTAPAATPSAVLASLQAATPKPSNEAWDKANAYVGTHPDKGTTVFPPSEIKT